MKQSKFKDAELVYKEILNVVHETLCGDIAPNNKPIWMLAEEKQYGPIGDNFNTQKDERDSWTKIRDKNWLLFQFTLYILWFYYIHLHTDPYFYYILIYSDLYFYYMHVHSDPYFYYINLHTDPYFYYIHLHTDLYFYYIHAYSDPYFYYIHLYILTFTIYCALLLYLYSDTYSYQIYPFIVKTLRSTFWQSK